MNNILSKMKNTRILAIIGVASLFIGTILPYIKISVWGITESASLFDYWEGKVVLFLALANLLFIFKDYVEKYVPTMLNSGLGKKIADLNNPKLSLIPTILAVVFMVYLHSDLNISGNEYVKYGLGFYIIWLGAISLVAHSFLYKGENIQMNTIKPSSVQIQQSVVNQVPPVQSVQMQQPVVNQVPPVQSVQMQQPVVNQVPPVQSVQMQQPVVNQVPPVQSVQTEQPVVNQVPLVQPVDNNMNNISQ